MQRIHFLDPNTLQEFRCLSGSLQWSYRSLRAPGIITGVTLNLHADASAAHRVRTYLARCAPTTSHTKTDSHT